MAAPDQRFFMSQDVTKSSYQSLGLGDFDESSKNYDKDPPISKLGYIWPTESTWHPMFQAKQTEMLDRILSIKKNTGLLDAEKFKQAQSVNSPDYQIYKQKVEKMANIVQDSYWIKPIRVTAIFLIITLICLYYHFTTSDSGTVLKNAPDAVGRPKPLITQDVTITWLLFAKIFGVITALCGVYTYYQKLQGVNYWATFVNKLESTSDMTNMMAIRGMFQSEEQAQEQADAIREAGRNARPGMGTGIGLGMGASVGSAIVKGILK